MNHINADREDRVRPLVEAYGDRSGLNPQVEDANTLVGDLICDLLHLVDGEGADWREVVNSGIWHFRTDTVHPDGVGDDEIFEDQHDNRCTLAQYLGISYQEAARRLRTADIDPLMEALESYDLHIDTSSSKREDA